MNRDKQRITKQVFEGFLCCRRKGLLRMQGVGGSEDLYPRLRGKLATKYRMEAKRRLAQCVGDAEDLISPSTVDSLELGKWMLFDASMTSEDYATVVDAVERNRGKSRLGAFRYSPIRFARAGRVERNERLLLAFDGIVIGLVQGVRPEGQLFERHELILTLITARSRSS